MIMKFINWIKSWWTKEETKVIVDEQTPVYDNTETVKIGNTVFKKGDIGVDISHHNKDVNLEVLCKNVEFIYMKATEGTTFLSRTWKERAEELKKIGTTPWGVYHYYRVNSDPVEQAEWFCKHVDPESGLPPVLDIEAINNNFKAPRHTKDLVKFLEKVEELTGVTPIVYTSSFFARDEIRAHKEPKLGKYPLWIAWYTRNFNRVWTPKPWEKITLWQYTETGRVEGVNGKVDINKVM